MKKKELIHLIKNKAQAIELKDIKQDILDQARHLPVYEPVITSKKRFYLRPALVYSFSLMLVVTAFFIFYSPTFQSAASIEDVNQVVALSSIAAASLVEAEDDEILSIDSLNIALDYSNLEGSELTPQINQEIGEVYRYFEMIEKFLKSDANFEYQIKEINLEGYTHQLEFSTLDLLDEAVHYRLNYNRFEDRKANQFWLEGVLEYGNHSYEINAYGDIKNPQYISLRLHQDTSNYIDIDFDVTTTSRPYQISKIQNNIIVEKASISFQKINDQHMIVLDLIEGNASGSYAFEINTSDQMSTMRGFYFIKGVLSESGAFDIATGNGDENAQYIINIQPNHGMPFQIEHGRDMSENRMPHGHGRP